MAEFLIAIALLCQVNPGTSSAAAVSTWQLECQKQLAQCIKDRSLQSRDILDCVIKRKD